ncbi:hypothetical protein [Stigmatella erecta]|uniref:Uncharacterized protein n=1 Tax=Stigmatella erecta TaxID=83460 RepID=A0A1I0CZY6_9BACT|nr:hypothetical protein [Stigmatella erecta]SET25457.1 hypothetical protein SAMN05443639_102325 [Stigmatella erecta]
MAIRQCWLPVVLTALSWVGCGVVEEAEAPGEAALATATQAASSNDYPGPCQSETTVPGMPQYLSSDYHGRNPDTRVVYLPDTGRFRLGISCVGTGFIVIRIGPDSALCQNLGKCEQWQLATLTEWDVNWVQSNFPAQVPFKHICTKHGFGWYDALGVPQGTYLAVARSDSGLFGAVDGHGTMDTYAYTGNGGAYQPVNCARPTVCGDGICNWWNESCDSCSQDCGTCSVCGDGLCGQNESCFSCTEDCGFCPDPGGCLEPFPTGTDANLRPPDCYPTAQSQK